MGAPPPFPLSQLRLILNAAGERQGCPESDALEQ